jgi:hypothetical protein
MKRHMMLAPMLALLAVTPSVQTQNPNPAENPAFPEVTFDCLWEAATPQEYTITVRSTGTGRYVSSKPARAPEDRAQDPDYERQFIFSSSGSARIFALAAQAKYFEGDFEYRKHHIASTGRKTLTYADMVRHFQTTYNWSDNPAIDELTRYFQGVSSTIEHGRKLEFLHRYDKLGLEAHLKGMEDEAQSRYLAELAIISPVLESVAEDASVLNIARQRARRLLEQARSESTGGLKTGSVKKAK